MAPQARERGARRPRKEQETRTGSARRQTLLYVAAEHDRDPHPRARSRPVAMARDTPLARARAHSRPVAIARDTRYAIDTRGTDVLGTTPNSTTSTLTRRACAAWMRLDAPFTRDLTDLGRFSARALEAGSEEMQLPVRTLEFLVDNRPTCRLSQPPSEGARPRDPNKQREFFLAPTASCVDSGLGTGDDSASQGSEFILYPRKKTFDDFGSARSVLCKERNT
jgi:hypothetical protein